MKHEDETSDQSRFSRKSRESRANNEIRFTRNVVQRGNVRGKYRGTFWFVKAVQLRLPAEGHIDCDLSGCGWILLDDVGGVFL